MTPTVTFDLQEVLNAARSSEQELIFYGVSWEDYQSLLDEILDRRYPRLTYFNGVLKIMGKQGFWHESTARFLQLIVMNTAFFLKQKTIASGSMSLISKRKSKGADPDESFYIQNADSAPNKRKLFNDRTDTPPDLVIEVDETSKSTEKFTIYADFGIREFWRVEKDVLKIYELDEFGSYREVERSIAFQILSVEILNEFLTRRAKGDQFDALLDFENWLREQTKQD